MRRRRNDRNGIDSGRRKVGLTWAMTWKFDQDPNVACITCRTVIDGSPILVVTHYDEDHSWVFLDGNAYDTQHALVVSMSEILERHPDIEEIANLSPGWSATRIGIGEQWIMQEDDWSSES